MSDAAHAELVRHLDGIIAGGPPTRVVFGLPGGRPPAGAAMVPGARLSCITAGCKHIQAWDGDRAVVHRLAPGEAIVMPPYGWTVPMYTSSRTFFGVVRHRDFTRFLLSEHVVGARSRAPQWWFHTARPMSAGCAHALGALAELAYGGPAVAREQLWIFLQFARAELSAAPGIPRDSSRAVWTALCEHLQQHLEQELGRDDVARRFRLHPSTVSQLFSRHGGETFGAYLTRVRIERAQELLAGDMPIATVARRCGFGDASYFIKVFRRLVGMTPGHWSRQRSGLGGAAAG